MKQYFSIDSTIFTVISVGFIIIGLPIWLLILSVLTIVFLILKSGVSEGFSLATESSDKWGIWSTFIYGGIFSIVLFGFAGLGIILFGFWFYILYQVYLA